LTNPATVGFSVMMLIRFVSDLISILTLYVAGMYPRLSRSWTVGFYILEIIPGRIKTLSFAI